MIELSWFRICDPIIFTSRVPPKILSDREFKSVLKGRLFAHSVPLFSNLHGRLITAILEYALVLVVDRGLPALGVHTKFRFASSNTGRGIHCLSQFLHKFTSLEVH